MADQKLCGGRVAIIAADMVERVELIEPPKALDDAGAHTELISMNPGEIETFNHYDKAEKERSTRRSTKQMSPNTTRC